MYPGPLFTAHLHYFIPGNYGFDFIPALFHIKIHRTFRAIHKIVITLYRYIPVYINIPLHHPYIFRLGAEFVNTKTNAGNPTLRMIYPLLNLQFEIAHAGIPMRKT